MEKEIRDKIRQFNRYYTAVLGVLNRQYLGCRFSLPETRIIQAIFHNPNCNANDIVKLLNIDKGYLSRLLKKFEQQNLILRLTSTSDRRSELLKLTDKGTSVFHQIDKTADMSVEEICSGLSEGQLSELVDCMDKIQVILDTKSMKEIEIRKFTPDYMQDVIDLVLHFQNDGTRPRVSIEDQPDLLSIEESYINAGGDFWIACEKENGNLVGSIGLKPYTNEVAVLKKFFVREPYQGAPYHLGQRLYNELIDFARNRNFKMILLDTPRNTTRAHKFYERAGFRLVPEEELPVRYSYPYADSDFFILNI